MNKKSLLAIERIISCINELIILTKDKKAEYFYNSFEMNALIDLLNQIELNINKINNKIKNKYNNIDWKIIEKEKKYDDVFGESLSIGKTWDLSSNILKNTLLNDLIKLLEEEIPNYYKKLCNKNHKIFVKKTSNK